MRTVWKSESAIISESRIPIASLSAPSPANLKSIERLGLSENTGFCAEIVDQRQATQSEAGHDADRNRSDLGQSGWPQAGRSRSRQRIVGWLAMRLFARGRGILIGFGALADRSAPGEYRNISTLWKIDTHAVMRPVVFVILGQRRAKARGLDAHDRVCSGIEGWRSAERVDGNGVGFERIAAPFHELLDDEAKKSLVPFRRMEFRIGEQSLQFREGFFSADWPIVEVAAR